MSNTLELIHAIAKGNAAETEEVFNIALGEKISAKLDDMRVNIAKSMFNPVTEDQQDEQEDTITEDQYNALSDEEKAEYEIVEGIVKKIGNVVNKAADAVGDAANAAGSLAGKAVGGVAKTVGAARQTLPAAGAAYNKGRVGAQNAIAGK
jgi:hypothetical protein